MQESHQRCRGSNSDRPVWRFRECTDSATRAGADWRLRRSFVSKKMADGVVRPEKWCSTSPPEARCSGSRPAHCDVSEEIGYRRDIGSRFGHQVKLELGFSKVSWLQRVLVTSGAKSKAGGRPPPLPRAWTPSRSTFQN